MNHSLGYSREVSEDKSSFLFPKLYQHPDWTAARFILETLKKQGYEALLAGGAVRDLLMKRTPGDLDIATSATPDEVEKLFPQTVAVGKAFGVIRVIQEGVSLEVATYRKDLDSLDGRRPVGVEFSDRVEDAKRRDLTVNALFLDPLENKIYDDVRGAEDIQHKILRCVGNPDERFQEDELRRLRLVRFVSQLGFQVEEKTDRALRVGLEGLQKISRERITEEIGKMWQGEFLPRALDYFLDSSMAPQIDPLWNSIKSIPPHFWNLPRATLDEAWVHYFSFFFEQSSLKESFKRFRLPKEREKLIETVFQIFKKMPQILTSPKGLQRFELAQKGALLALFYYIEHKASESDKSELKKTLAWYQSLGALPPPLVKAEHLQNQYSGAQLGAQLREHYIVQLDQDLQTPDQVLGAVLKIKSSQD